MTKANEEDMQHEGLQLAKASDAIAFQRMREQYAASIPAYEAEQKQRNLDRAAMSEEQRKRHEALDYARASAGLSGYTISEEDVQRSLRWANGEITMDEFLDVSRPC
ncbi:antitoxin VbhA family protein [Janthinobacterium sp. RB2R34]|uniref:antitoxin VbhA family protein n=1 Tax=Janthinobacterium sp. RB2R34 TaxID=3424193 RepID=UPI003F24A4D8